MTQFSLGMVTSRCSSCDEPIHWVRSAENGKPIPLQVEKKKIVTMEGRVVIGHEVHFAYCPNAEEHRKK